MAFHKTALLSISNSTYSFTEQSNQSFFMLKIYKNRLNKKKPTIYRQPTQTYWPEEPPTNHDNRYTPPAF